MDCESNQRAARGCSLFVRGVETTGLPEVAIILAHCVALGDFFVYTPFTTKPVAADSLEWKWPFQQPALCRLQEDLMSQSRSKSRQACHWVETELRTICEDGYLSVWYRKPRTNAGAPCEFVIVTLSLKEEWPARLTMRRISSVIDTQYPGACSISVISWEDHP